MSNVEMNLGNLYGQRRNYQESIKHYLKAIEISPHNPANKDKDLPEECPFDRKKYAPIIFSGKLNNESAYIDAHTNLAVMYIQVDEIDKAYQYCEKALELDPTHSESIINFTDILRQLGRKEQAIKRTWEEIVNFTKK